MLVGGAWATSAPGARAPQLQGQWQQGGLIVGLAAPGAQVWFNDQPLRVLPDGHFAFGFHRDDPATARLRVRWSDGSQWQSDHAVLQREYDVQRINGLPKAMVTPPAAVLARVSREAEQVRMARLQDRPLPGFFQGFVWPAPGPLSSVYGSQRILNGEPRQPHYGVDIAAATGTPVVAVADGEITLAETDLYYTGGTIILDHGAGVSSTYLHLSRVLVQSGQQVRRGQKIGEVGATGRVTGPHLCFRFNWFESRLDPQLLLPAHGTP